MHPARVFSAPNKQLSRMFVLSLPDACAFYPRYRTLVFRIADPNLCAPLRDIYPLLPDPRFTEFEYHFADLDPDDCERHKSPALADELRTHAGMFTPEIADKILDDFSAYHTAADEFVVHCIGGISRSPAVAMALNEVFDLGFDGDALRKVFGAYNTTVYRIMKEQAGVR